ncbi:hypothetical protein BDK51DRAFT_27932 [Blyttiomyces helicus]|uniref:Galactose oxidase n=1 Tax=Blyttiomyces helicus TaxID=388810 RepID=A0A4P9WKA9_9FUNG|nr:hypothetical protein BDK51DRAFT_27932 [Blyttiomyces helicus]|eukprot:RKO91590.1 hypothetical protein BDK51DRAFT_27932 [Blyttiomyces helicus]
MQAFFPLVLLLLAIVAVEALPPSRDLSGLALLSCPATARGQDTLFLYGGGRPTGVWRYDIPTSNWTQLATTQPSYDTTLADTLSGGYVPAALCLNSIYGTLHDGSFTHFVLDRWNASAPGAWATVPPAQPPSTLWRSARFVLGDFFVGGFPNVPTFGSMTRATQFGHTLNGGAGAGGSDVGNNTLVMLGGNADFGTNPQPGMEVYTFDPSASTPRWTQRPVTVASGFIAPTSLYEVTCAVVGSVLFVFSDKDRTTVGQLHKLNLTSWSWISVHDPAVPIPTPVAPTVVDGALPVAPDVNLYSFARFDVDARTWDETLAPTTAATLVVSASFVMNSSIFFVDGMEGGTSPLDSTTIYHTDNNTWENGPAYPHPVNRAGGTSNGDTGYVFGGCPHALRGEKDESLEAGGPDAGRQRWGVEYGVGGTEVYSMKLNVSLGSLPVWTEQTVTTAPGAIAPTSMSTNKLSCVVAQSVLYVFSDLDKSPIGQLYQLDITSWSRISTPNINVTVSASLTIRCEPYSRSPECESRNGAKPPDPDISRDL